MREGTEELEMMEGSEMTGQSLMTRSWTYPHPSLNVRLSSQAPLAPMEMMGQLVFQLVVLSFKGELECGGNQEED